MTDTKKPKKVPSTRIDYNDMWLFRLYRRLRWHKIQMMKVQTSYEACLVHLQRLVNRSEYKYIIQTQEDELPHQFQVEVISITSSTRYSSTTYRYTSMATVVGTIIKDNRGESRNVIVFRAYPDAIWSRLFLTLALLFAIRVFGALQAIDFVYVAMSIVATVWLIFSWHAYFANRNEGLELVTAHFLPLLGLSDKTKADTESIAEEHNDQQTKTQE